MSFIEVIRRPKMDAPPTHAVFDHDGTLSTIRYGWEKIMAPMMIKAICGTTVFPPISGTDSAFHDVSRDVHDYIDRTTGIQTIAQMQGLVSLVKEYGLNPVVLDAAGYKAVYNDELMTLVNSRIEPLTEGYLSASDLEIKNASRFIQTLERFGVEMHLVSGTDQMDVIREAILMDYSHHFSSINGSIGKIDVEAKSIILQRIFASISGAPSVVVIGDGPVEIREGAKIGAFTIGIISDEVRRHGRNEAKRQRLIDAGADVLIPDFSDIKSVLKTLCL